MGLGTYDGCPTDVQSHDNGDVHAVFNQGTQQVERVFFEEFNWEPSGFHHRLFWDPDFVGDEDQQHGESNFVILRSQSVYSGFADWSGSTRNTHAQDGLGCCTNQLGPADVGVWFAEHWCFRIRPFTLFFGGIRIERFGMQTNGICIVRSSTTNPNVVTRTSQGNFGPTEGIFVDIRNQTSSSVTITGLQIRSPGGGSICTLGQTTLAPGQTTGCWFASYNTKSHVEVWYNGGLQSFVGYDSALAN
jgi:hypothetical protein